MNWILIDGNNWFAQCYFANQEYVTRNFIGRLQTVLQQVPYEKAAVCWDIGDSFRVEIASSYKAHRESKGEDFHECLRQSREAVQSLGIAGVSLEKYEADDCIATLTTMALAQGKRAVLFSADKDLHQLLRAGSVSQVTQIERLTANRMKFSTVTADALLEKYGVRADQWIDYRAIVGDPSDGIAGCPGLGKAAATEILQQSGTLDAFYARPFEARLSDKQRTAMINYRKDLADVRKMLTLVDDLPLAAQLAGGKPE